MARPFYFAMLWGARAAAAFSPLTGAIAL